MDTWGLVAAERRALLVTLEPMPESAWLKPSLSAGRTAKDTLAHIIATAEMTPLRFVGKLVRAGLSFERMTGSEIARIGADPPQRLVERLRGLVDSHGKPPGPTGTMLLETVIHGEDIAYPQGRSIAHLPEALVATAEFAKGAQPIVGIRKRVAGLRLHATDVDWGSGDGPEVAGPMVPLLLAMSGRPAGLDALRGDGVAVLRSRA